MTGGVGGAMALAGLLAYVLPLTQAFCPVGFDNPDNVQHKEWKIPQWPQTMNEWEAGRLRTIELKGFDKAELNQEYLEGPTVQFFMQGKETYWNAGGEFFMYYCKRYAKWRIAGLSAFSQNMEGDCFGFVSDLHPKRDVKNSSLIKEWIEVVNGTWKIQEQAGVVRVGTLSEQLLAAAGDAEECASAAAEGDEMPEDHVPFGDDESGGGRTRKCPMKAVGEKVQSGLAAIGKWVRRLFPKHLAAPEEDVAEDTSEKEETTPVPVAPLVPVAPPAEKSFKVQFTVYNLDGEQGKHGSFVVLVQPKWAPIGAARFRELVELGVWEKTRFYHAIKGGAVQFGIPGQPSLAQAWRDKKIKDDPMQADPMKGNIGNLRGYVSFAKESEESGEDARTSQIFINLDDNRELDLHGYSPVGRVIEGMEETVEHVYMEYEDKPLQEEVETKGNTYLKKEFPKLSYIKGVVILDSEATTNE